MSFQPGEIWWGKSKAGGGAWVQRKSAASSMRSTAAAAKRRACVRCLGAGVEALGEDSGQPGGDDLGLGFFNIIWDADIADVVGV